MAEVQNVDERVRRLCTPFGIETLVSLDVRNPISGVTLTVLAPNTRVCVAAHTPVSPLLAGVVGVTQRRMIVSGRRGFVTFAGLAAWGGKLAIGVYSDDELVAVDGTEDEGETT